MKLVGIALSLAALATPALAQSRPDTRKLTCVGVRNLVQSRGAIVVSTSDNAYDRVVWTQTSCNRGEAIRAAYARTTDYTGCHIGYTCEQPGRRP